MKVQIDERWSLEQKWTGSWKTPSIILRDEHSYSRVVTRENDSLLFNFLEMLIDREPE